MCSLRRAALDAPRRLLERRAASRDRSPLATHLDLVSCQLWDLALYGFMKAVGFEGARVHKFATRGH